MTPHPHDPHTQAHQPPHPPTEPPQEPAMSPDRLDSVRQAQLHAHRHAAAGGLADADRSEAIDDFWRGADAVWARLQQGLGERLHRSARRLQARLDRRAARC